MELSTAVSLHCEVEWDFCSLGKRGSVLGLKRAVHSELFQTFSCTVEAQAVGYKMGVAEILAWGAPAVLVLLHMHLVCMRELKSNEAGNLVFVVFVGCFAKWTCVLRSMIGWNIFLEKARPVPPCAVSGTKFFSNVQPLKLCQLRQGLWELS